MIKAGIAGGAGYTGGELIRILINHPQVEIVFVHSVSNAGNKIYQVHRDLLGETEIVFTDKLSFDIDVLFLCMGHGQSGQFIQENSIPARIKIIDLSQDFRISKSGNDFVYGLPELNKSQIKEATHVANPGCFATGIQLALLPLAHKKLLNENVHVNAITGSTGAGQAPSATTHFSWRNNNISIYKAFTHQHLKEINQSVKQLQPDFMEKIYFIPVRGDFTRGILTSAYTQVKIGLEEATVLYREFYRNHPFTVISEQNPDLKQVVNTNKCVIYLEKHEDVLLAISIIDNLVKGASGQAVHNMNLMFGLDEKAGLNLKPAAF
jgi:N-acetyl-gamma-glutamyl-phosphate reductase